MCKKEENRALVSRVLSGPYWTPEYADCFTGDFTLELPYAPPGMPQNLCHGQTVAHFIWLSQSVKTWALEPDSLEVYGLKGNPELFWAVRTAGGGVHWGGRDGRFSSRFVTKVELRDGKISRMKDFSDPLAYLRAAGREAPVFKVGLDHEEAARRQAAAKPAPYIPDPHGDAPEVIAQKVRDNIDSLVHGQFQKRVNGPVVDHYCWFVPHEMKTHYTPEEDPAMDVWMERSLLEWTTHCDPICYETDDPEIWFFECGGYGYAEWQGNGSAGGYQNRYVKFLKMEKGECVRSDEYLNPINKLNAINAVIPSFPYFY
ncbi:hypothetical protein CE91St41_33550 [Oscillospiraceae bacterium]|nr:hypothetical protein CE91St40_33540 [Oscillospiraceae bacterium]BDF76466.1 hypothetical protein CE91St41_33550 [Oscillospiraceae bacterium]